MEQNTNLKRKARLIYGQRECKAEGLQQDIYLLVATPRVGFKKGSYSKFDNFQWFQSKVCTFLGASVPLDSNHRLWLLK